MKPIKFSILLVCMAFFVCHSAFSQPTHRTLTATIAPYDFGGDIGVVHGTYSYHFMYFLNNEGFIDRIHWNVVNVDLYNAQGQKIRVIDSGLDTYGVLWGFWNTLNQSNMDLGAPEFTYDVDDHWLDPYMPATTPDEGIFVNMNARVQLKNKRFSFAMLWIVKFNANGDPVVDFLKFH